MSLFLIFIFFTQWTQAQNLSVVDYYEGVNGVYFTEERHKDTKISSMIMKNEIKLFDIKDVESSPLDWVRATLYKKNRSFDEIKALPASFKGRRFVSRMITAQDNCQFDKDLAEEVIGLSKATDVKSNEFLGEKSYICSFTFAVQKNSSSDLAKKIISKAKETSLIKVNFGKIDFKIYKYKKVHFDLQALMELLMGQYQVKGSQFGNSIEYGHFVWAASMRDNAEIWGLWKALNPSEQETFIKDVFPRLFQIQDDAIVDLNLLPVENSVYIIDNRVKVSEVGYEI